MPSAWEWWAGDIGEQCYSLGHGDNRDDVIRQGMRETRAGESFQIIEAQSSTAKRYSYGDEEFVPFVRTRNHEIIINGPKEVS